MHYLCCIILQKGWENCFTNSPTRHHFFQIWSWREMDRVGVTLLIKGSTLCKPITKPEFSRGPRGRAVHTRHSLPTFLRHFSSKELYFFMSEGKRRKNNLSSKLDELLDQMQSPDLSRSISKYANVDASSNKTSEANVLGRWISSLDDSAKEPQAQSSARSGTVQNFSEIRSFEGNEIHQMKHSLLV